MECYATDLSLSFGFCFYFPLWLFFNFLISCLSLLSPPVCKPKAVGIAIRAKVVKKGDKKLKCYKSDTMQFIFVCGDNKTFRTRKVSRAG